MCAGAGCGRPGQTQLDIRTDGRFLLITAIRGREEKNGCLGFYCLFKANVLKGVFLWQKN